MRKEALGSSLEFYDPGRTCINNKVIEAENNRMLQEIKIKRERPALSEFECQDKAVGVFL